MDKNKFKEILTIIDSNKFGYKNKIGKFKYIDTKDLVNNIRNNTISETDAKKRLNTLTIIKNSEIEHRRLIPGQKELLKLFDYLPKIILTDKTLESQKSENYEAEDEDEDEYKDEDEDYKNKNEYEYENKNKDEDYENKNEYEYKNENKNKDDNDKTIDQNKIIKGVNDILDEIIDKSKSFKEHIESLKRLKGLKGYWPYKDYDDKELKSKYFKIQLANMSNEIDKKLFEEIFGHALIKLTDKLINTTNKEENKIIVDSIKKHKDKLSKMKDYSDEWVIQPNSQCINLLNTIDLILNFNEKLN